jgi:chemotaxis protein histidine kinase CheA
LRIPSALVVARSNSQGIFVFKITMEKKCTKCGEVKSLDEFHYSKKGKHRKKSMCKDCCKKYSIKYYNDNKEEMKQLMKEWRENNKEDKKKQDKEWRENNKEYCKQYHAKYYSNNTEKSKEDHKTWRKNNKEKMKEYDKNYREDNKEKIKEYKNNYRVENKEKIKVFIKNYRAENKEKINASYRIRRETDPLFKLRCNIGSNIRNCLKNQGYTKKTKTYNMLKCDYNFFMQWLNGIASNGYQYGFGNLNLDHVVPISLAETEEEILLLCHYSNYQLLNATENIVKGNRYVNPTNLKRVLEHHPNPDKIREIHARL